MEEGELDNIMKVLATVDRMETLKLLELNTCYILVLNTCFIQLCVFFKKFYVKYTFNNIV